MTTEPTDQLAATNEAGLRALREALRVSFLLVRVLIGVLVLGFLCSGVRSLDQHENGIVLRFGAPHGEVRREPGIIFALPYPVGDVVTVPAKRIQTLETDTFWYQLTGKEKQGDSGVPTTLKPGVDGYLLTSGRSILHARATLKYRIGDPVRYAFGTGELTPLLKSCLDSALLQAAGTVSADDALRDTEALSRETTRRLAGRLTALELGVEVDSVNLHLDWPRQLRPQLDRVTQATQVYQQEVAAARVFSTSQDDEAQSQTAQLAVTAKTAATRTVTRTAADAATFEKLYPLYQQNPSVIRRVLHEDALRVVMGQVEELFLVEARDGQELRLLLPRRPPPASAKQGKRNEGNE